MKEIEILVSVFDDEEKVISKLSKFKYIGKKRVVDTYFFDPVRDNLKPDEDTLELTECFRTREKDGEYFVTYKVDNFDESGKWIYSDEFETKVDSIETMTTIINKLGLKELLKLDNNKYVYETEEYEIVYEQVKDLGNFLEVEAYIDNDDVDEFEIRENIMQFISELEINVSPELNTGKPEMMLKKNRFN